MVSRSLRPSAFGEKTAGVTVTSPRVRFTLSGISFCTATPCRRARGHDDVVVAVGERCSVDGHGVLPRTRPDPVDDSRNDALRPRP